MKAMDISRYIFLRWSNAVTPPLEFYQSLLTYLPIYIQRIDIHEPILLTTFLTVLLRDAGAGKSAMLTNPP